MTDIIATPESPWQPFRCEVIPEREAVRVKPAGELDLATVEDLSRPLRELCRAGFSTIVLDLSELVFIDSTGIRAILDALDDARRHGVSLRVLPGPPVVQRALELTGVAGMLFA